MQTTNGDLPTILADEIGLAYLRQGMLIARTAFEPLQPARAQEVASPILRASTAWFLGGREVRQEALGATGFSCGDAAFELACALAHMRNLFFEEPDAKLLLALPALDEASTERFLKALDGEAETGDIEPDRVVFELTAETDRTHLADMSAALRMRGFALGIGDFGGMGSSAALIETVDPNFVRLDTQWVRLAGGIDPSRRLLSSLVSLLHDGGRTTVLAGIASVEDREAALAIGVDLIAGPLIAPPYLAGTDGPHRPAAQEHGPAQPSRDNVIPLTVGRSHHGR